MESKLQHAHGGVGWRMYGRDYGRRSPNHLLSKHKNLSHGFMASKITRLIMVAQLAFFAIAGIQIAVHGLECAKNEATTTMLLSMTPAELSQINI